MILLKTFVCMYTTTYDPWKTLVSIRNEKQKEKKTQNQISRKSLNVNENEL